MIRRALIWFARLTVGLLLFCFVVLFTLLLALQNKEFKSIAAKRVTAHLSRRWGAELYIGSLEGNLYSHFCLKKASLIFHSDTLLSIARLEASYRLKPLLHKQLFIDSLCIDHPKVRLLRNENGEPILITLFKLQPESTPESPSIKRGMGRPFTLFLDRLILRNGHVESAGGPDWVPEETDSIHIDAQLQIGRANRFALHRAHFSTRHPNLKINNLRFILQSDSAGVELRDFELRTAENCFFASAAAQKPLLTDGHFTLQTDSLNAQELHLRLPTLRIPGRPSLSLNGSLTEQILQADLAVSSDQAFLRLQGNVHPFPAFFSDSLIERRFSLQARVQKLQITDWLASVDGPSEISGEIEATGSGTSWRAMSGRAVVQLSGFYREWKATSLNAQIELAAGSLSGELEARLPAGDVKLFAQIDDFFGRQKFKTRLIAEGIDLAALPAGQLPSSHINLQLRADGSGLSLQRLMATGTLAADATTVAGMSADSLRLWFAVQEKRVIVDTMALFLPQLMVTMNGSASFAGRFDAELAARFGPCLYEPPLRSLPQLCGVLSAELHGTIDSLAAKANLRAAPLLWDSLRVDTLALAAEATLIDGRLGGRYSLKTRDIRRGSLKFAKVTSNGTIHNHIVDLDLNIAHAVGDLRAAARILRGDSLQVELGRLDLDLRDQAWRLVESPARICLADDNLCIDNLHLGQAMPDSAAGRLRLNGRLSKSGRQEMTLDISQFNLHLLSRLNMNLPIVGILEAHLDLSGDAKQPIMQLEADIENGGYREAVVDRARILARYADETLTANSGLFLNGDSLSLQVTLPLRITQEEGKIERIQNRPLFWKVDTELLPLEKLLQAPKPFDDLRGSLEVHVFSQDNLDFVRPQGTIRLRDGRILLQKFGFELGPLQADVALSPKLVRLEQLTGRRGRGLVRLSGAAEFDRHIEKVDLRAVAERFVVSKRSPHELQVDADLYLRGAPPELILGGTIRVLQAAFHTAAFSSAGSPEVEETKMPLLVEALGADSLVIPEKTEASGGLPLWPNLRTEIKVILPRNCWIYNNNLRVELAGEADIFKTREEIQVFGTIRTLRGWYELLGKRFTLAEGEITFQGGKVEDAQLSVKADYIFRDSQRNRRTLRLTIRGKVAAPEFAFTVDDQPVTEGEAVAYMLFGKSLADMSNTRLLQAGVRPERLAADAAAGLLTAQLARRLGNVLDLDMVELQGQENFNAASFVVGKYLTPDLFFSYEQTLGVFE
ncbi:MAG: translocation/assembly module TamB domain-containing protein, partial [candidate division KSB1 bacterium]|nr:translocation/assembly module TamB domain-containing protein [candidate division KSB1 bacterium]